MTTASLVITPRPTIAVLTLLLGSVAGSIAMGLFYINTFFVASLPLWWAAAYVFWLKALETDKVT